LISVIDVAFPSATGGTTGLSRCDALHHNVVANILKVKPWFAPMLNVATGH
jgi:hypothetical protein